MYKFEEIVRNDEYRERVIKHMRLETRLSASFEKFMDDMEYIKQTDVDKYRRIIKVVEHDFNKVSGEQNTDSPDFTMENELYQLVERFKSTDEWKDFIEKDYSDVLDDYEGVTNIHGLYNEENDGKYMVSVDLVSANWQSLQKIIGFDEEYEDLILDYTSNLIPPMSKTFRTKVTGLLGAKKIMDYNKFLLKDNLEQILSALSKKTKLTADMEPFAFYADEVLFIVDKETHDVVRSLQSELERDVYRATGVKTHVTTFQLKWLGVEKICAKVFSPTDYQLINISKDIKMLYNKCIDDIEITEADWEKVNTRGKTREEYLDMLVKSLELLR